MTHINVNPLIFYDCAADWANRNTKWLHNRSYAFGNYAPLKAGSLTPLPFQVEVDVSAEVFFAYLFKHNKNSDDEVVQRLEIGVDLIDKGTYKIVKCSGLGLYDEELEEGLYYITVETTADKYLSEIFVACKSLDNCIEITWGDYRDFEYNGGEIDYSGGFLFKAYIHSQIGMPEYEYSEEAEDRDGYTFIQKQISEKTYKFTFTAPEYLLDAMRLIRLSDKIVIKSDGKEYNVDTFLITPEWEHGGFVAVVEAEFQTDTILKKIGGSLPRNGGYGNDYNDDYNNEIVE